MSDAALTQAQQIARARLYRYTWLLAVLGLLALMSVVRMYTGQERLTTVGTFRQMIVAASPILLAALGGLWAERAGIVNIGLEGQMLLGTWGAAFFAYHYGPYAGLAGAVLMGLIGGLLHALATVTFGVDHIVSGVAINIIALGAVGFLARQFFDGLDGGGPRNLSGYPTPGSFSIPGISQASRWLGEQGWFLVSDAARFIAALTTNVSVVTVLVIALVVATALILWRSAFGLRLRSCGENPYAAETLGVNVYLYKYIAMAVSGSLAGLGGAYLTMVASGSFIVDQTNGRGFIGLAAMIFGNWHPSGAVFGALLFGYADGVGGLSGAGVVVHAVLLVVAIALAVYAFIKFRAGERVTAAVLVGLSLGAFVWHLTTDSVAPVFASMTPYVLTLFVLAVAAQRLRMPTYDGERYRKGSAG